MQAYSGGSAIVTLAATDTLRIKIELSRGANTNTAGNEQRCYFHIARIA